MKWLSILFLASLLLGQVGGISLTPGVVVYVHDVFLAVLLADVLLHFRYRKFRNLQMTNAVLFFVGAAVVSLLFNVNALGWPTVGVASLYLIRWVFYAAVVFVVVQKFLPPVRWLYGLFAVGVGFGVLGLFQFFLYPDLRNLMYLGWDPHYYRLFSTLLDPNFAGILFVLTCLLGLALWENKKVRIWICLGEVVSAIGLLLTYSRSSYLAAAAAIVTLAILQKQWKILLAILILGLLVVFIPRTQGSTLSLLRADSTFARVGSWEQGVALISAAPLFGHGFDTLRYLTPASPASKSAAGLDSSILFVGATTGVVGMLAYGYLIFSMIKTGRKNIVYLASLAAIGVHSLFVNSAFYPWVMIWMWVLTGVLLKISGDK